MTVTPSPHESRFFNRELSWLAFNERVLEEAVDPATPLLERAKFAAIAASNLDEFFMVRVARLKQMIEEEDPTADLAGLTARQQLTAVSERAHAFVAALYESTLHDLLPALTAHGIRLVPFGDLDPPRQASLNAFFRDEILPVLTPLAIDISRPFPLLSSLSLNLALLLEPTAEDPGRRLAIVQVPSGLARLVQIASSDGVTFVLLEDIIREHLPQLFRGQKIRESSVIRIARDAELELDDEGGTTHLEVVERELRRRRQSDAVRIEMETGRVGRSRGSPEQPPGARARGRVPRARAARLAGADGACRSTWVRNASRSAVAASRSPARSRPDGPVRVAG